MPRPSHRVAIVVDRAFGERIAELAPRVHTWVVDSPVNRPVIERAPSYLPPDPPGADPLASGLSWFAVDPHAPPDVRCAGIAEEVDEHHGEYAHDPPWSEIEVFGCEATPAVREAFEAIGATEFEPTPDGFIARRDVVPDDACGGARTTS